MPWVAGLSVRVLTHERARSNHTPVVDALEDLVRRHRLAGITVTRALEGLSEHGRLRAARAFELGEDLPIVIELLDRAERLEPLLPDIAHLITSGVLAVSPVRLYFPAAELQVGDVMLPARVVARLEAPLREVVHQLLDGSAQLIPVVDDRGVVRGIITLGHLLQHSDALAVPHLPHLSEHWTAAHVRAHVERLIEGRTAGAAMLTRFQSVRPDTPLDVAARMLTQHQITRAPVVDQDYRILGILTERALVAALVAPLTQERTDDGAQRVEESEEAEEAARGAAVLRQQVTLGAGESLTAVALADTSVPTLADTAPWHEVVQALRQTAGDNVLVVGSDGTFRGLIDANDVLRRAILGAGAGTLAAVRRLLGRSPQLAAVALGEHPPGERTAGALMRRDMPQVAAETPVAEALEQMLQAAGSGDVAVVLASDSHPHGLLRRDDALRALVEV